MNSGLVCSIKKSVSIFCDVKKTATYIFFIHEPIMKQKSGFAMLHNKPSELLKAKEMSIPESAFDFVISMQPFIQHTSTDTVAASIHGILAKLKSDFTGVHHCI